MTFTALKFLDSAFGIVWAIQSFLRTTTLSNKFNRLGSNSSSNDKFP